MQKINKTTSAPLAAAFFALSFAIMPFSLKVVGFTLSLNPSMSAAIDVWNQMAGSFGAGHQPATPAELMAINDLDSNGASDATAEPVSQNSLLAKLDLVEPGLAHQHQFLAAEVEGSCPNAPKAKSLKAAAPPARSVKYAGVDSYYKQIQVSLERRAEALKIAEAARASASEIKQLAELNKRLDGVRLDFSSALKNIPFNRGVRVFVRVNQVKPAAPKLTACDLRAAPMGGKTPQDEARASTVESTATGSDNCEL